MRPGETGETVSVYAAFSQETLKPMPSSEERLQLYRYQAYSDK